MVESKAVLLIASLHAVIWAAHDVSKVVSGVMLEGQEDLIIIVVEI